jgi:hypothetical protein
MSKGSVSPYPCIRVPEWVGRGSRKAARFHKAIGFYFMTNSRGLNARLKALVTGSWNPLISPVKPAVFRQPRPTRTSVPSVSDALNQQLRQTRWINDHGIMAGR